jgi:exodeoxyribonuclease V alpha subunit
VIAACVRRLVVISGGPGTGKTTTVAKILAARQMLAAGRPLTIKLAAYTGKAADRLKQSITAVKPTLGLPAEVLKSIPEEASTIHRLMGMTGSGRPPGRNAASPLGLDLLVLDEASMIDLSMLAKVLDALPPSAGLILLGDRDQLHAVQPGSVFGDICSAEGHSQELYGLLGRVLGEKLPEKPARGMLQDNLFTLTRSFRFKSDSGIGRLARAINEGDADAAVSVLRNDPSGEIRWRETADPGSDAALRAAVMEWLTPYFALVNEGKSDREIFDVFNRFRLLTPLRNGPDDVDAMNEAILSWIRRSAGKPAELQQGGRVPEWYQGRPVIINENNYALGVYNGDIGIALREKDGMFSVAFPGEGGTWRRFSPGRLPAHDTAYACTVHKSQGSEFENVLLLIPEGENPVVTRNLLYTGVTRAKKSCLVWGSEAAIRGAILRKPKRASGLAGRLE